MPLEVCGVFYIVLARLVFFKQNLTKSFFFDWIIQFEKSTDF